jgi:hypothetical protein
MFFNHKNTELFTGLLNIGANITIIRLQEWSYSWRENRVPILQSGLENPQRSIKVLDMYYAWNLLVHHLFKTSNTPYIPVNLWSQDSVEHWTIFW